jgi:hypothetical protein
LRLKTEYASDQIIPLTKGARLTTLSVLISGDLPPRPSAKSCKLLHIAVLAFRWLPLPPAGQNTGTTRKILPVAGLIFGNMLGQERVVAE